MSEYKSIKGKTVQFLGTDPSETSTEGQVWYNSAAGAFKSVVVSEAWSSGGNLITGRQGVGGAGTQDAALAISGRTYPAPYVGNTEEYNGSGWATGGATSNTRIYAATSKNGSQTACFIASGQTPSVTSATEEYDGSSWTAGGTVNTARANAIGFGTLTSGVMAGSGPSYNSVEEYNGTAWTTVTNIGTARYTHGGSGLETAGLIFGGAAPGPSNIATTEEYDGTSWTAGSDMNTARNYITGFGIQSNTTANGGGYPSASNTVKTENYDGTTWTNKPDSANTRWATDSGFGTSGSAGGVSGALANGPLTNVSATEEYNKSANVITPAAWASGGNMLYVRSNVADGGTQTAAIEGAGRQDNPDAVFTTSSEYNGSSWTSGNSLPTNYGSGTGATGTQTALITGGAASGSSTTFEYDGTNWTTGGSLGTGRYSGKNLGTQTAAVYCGGRVSPPTLNNVEEYDGSTWTAATGMPIAIRNSGGYGIQTAGTIVSGFQGPSTPPVSPTSSISRALLGFDYDGTSWTAGTSALIAGASGGAAGTQTNAIYLAGENPALSPGGITTSQKYDGTAYTTDASVGARTRSDGIGITSARTAEVGSAAMIFGGYNPPATPGNTNSTEEYNVATSAINIKTLTTS